MQWLTQLYRILLRGLTLWGGEILTNYHGSKLSPLTREIDLQFICDINHLNHFNKAVM